ncbi:hypothetical protein ACIBD9_18160 [Micromonospora sp. NPDC050784]|uniref:hypothetical protein n=1 Tax=Micromonospora sp. NPDC050784 TaxID=3364281 RepID=UPI00379645D4
MAVDVSVHGSGADGPVVDRARRARLTRLVVGYGVVAAVVPYLLLKVLWIGGVMLGVPEGSPASGADFVGPNIVTAAMDVVAVLVALAFTHRWGLRLPVWLVLAPVWVGTGLLAPAVIEVVNGALAGAVTGGREVSLAGGLVAPWVYVVVYTSFALQGLLLGAAFVRYARSRWPYVFDRLSATGIGATRGLQVVLACAGGAAAVAVAVAHLVMAFSAEGAFVGAYQEGWEYTARSGEVVNAAMAVSAAVGVLLMLRWPAGGSRTAVPAGLVLTWIGTGAMFGYALLTLLAVVLGAPESDNVTALNGLTQLGALLAGPVLAITGALHLLERRTSNQHSPLPGDRL